ncbi:hypothetical protein Z517_03239 [Fonsecaea pedrosoi CBS 271.37]|uniref:F-box domain-containing protein n=1 Tax=Fonsecaea pedrosoi CBS 271.37 TaxID=1442368 RepID=A0A0D2GSP1_9EURO|nr:uncharacterized protein Z517_03239 [Fonsecaea pedrosoi CBS 271.37]KIW83993.1 hypothetical protein Z517_03239 [Fonsecaea pedrosoi CBS 271.37]
MTNTNILSLEAEVLAHVLEYVDNESPRTMAAVARTCKYFNFVTQLVRYRHITVHWDCERESWVDMAGRKQEEWETPELLQGLRHLTACKGDLPALILELGNGDLPGARNLCEKLDRLQSVLRNASNLKTLTWKTSYLPTKGIVETLQAHQPKVKLDIFRARRLGLAQIPLESEKVLAAATCLNSLSMTTMQATCIEDHLVFHMILKSAPNLEFASILSFPPMESYSPTVTFLRPNLDSWFPPDLEGKQGTSLRHLTLDGWGISAECLEFWSEYVNLASLRGLKCSRGPIYSSFFDRAPKLLTNLKSFSTNLGAEPRSDVFLRAVKEYIATCPPLETLSLWSWRGKVPLSTILNRHGATLRDLQLHECEAPESIHPRDAFSAEELQSIRLSCPRLKVLTLDLNRVSAQLRVEEYEAILDELRKMNLDKIQIYVENGLPWFRQADLQIITRESSWMEALRRVDNDQTDIRLPSGCDFDGAFGHALPVTVQNSDRSWPHLSCDEELTLLPPTSYVALCRFLIGAWKIIFGSRTWGPRQLDVKLGEWEKKYQPTDYYIRELRRDSRAWVRAKPHERDDMVGECFVELECCGGDHKRKFSSR